ncbi:MAG TPA: PP2C family protein-serine/threonine phosphatase [Planctomycetota bacterium]
MEPKAVYAGADLRVLRIDLPGASVLRFEGACTPELARWLPSALKDISGPLAFDLGGLSGLEAPFVQRILDHARLRGSVALVNPTPEALDVLRQLSAEDRLPILSCEAAILPGGSIPDSTGRERLALLELEARHRHNPRWRRADADGVWVCPLCGLDVEAVRVVQVGKPDVATLRRMRRHILQDCPASRAGRRDPLPAVVLDAFLESINERKRSDEEERKRGLARELATLQRRVESMRDLERSVDQAKLRQLHLLPVDPAPDPIAELAVHYRPLEAVSGDFLDFYDLDGDRFGVVLGDVSGHGVETAIILGMAKMAMRVRSRIGGPLTEIVSHANGDLFAELRRTAFITGQMAVIDRRSRRMSYVRLGQPKPLLRRTSGELLELEGNGLPLGVDAGARFGAALEERAAELAPGDLLLFYTDGLVEASAGSEQFGVDRLKEAFAAVPADAPPRRALEAVVGAFDRFLGANSPGDDVTAICLRVR